MSRLEGVVRVAARSALVPSLLVAMLGCSKHTPELGQADPSASVSAAASNRVASAAPTFNHKPRANPVLKPPEDLDAMAPIPQREPDWDLDPDDPWRDYVTRYVRSTKRYGDATDCVTVGPAEGSGGKRNVTVRGDPKGSCGDATPKDDSVRDVFVVDVAGDRLGVDDPGTRAHLGRWPDGSDPDGPAKMGVPEVENLQKAKTGILDALRDLQLVTIRGQTYGRGTYLVLTIAGWHGTILAKMSPAELKPAADRLCNANGRMPFGMFAGVDRVTILRFTCGPEGGKARWDKL